MYTMKEVSKLTGLSYDTLKFYCNEGLIPNVKRNSRNYRVFDDQDIAWISSVLCLRKCGMSLKAMKEFLDLCLEGEQTIPRRLEILGQVEKDLEERRRHIDESIAYVYKKMAYYHDVQKGGKPYFSNLFPEYADKENPFEENCTRLTEAEAGPAQSNPSDENQKIASDHN